MANDGDLIFNCLIEIQSANPAMQHSLEGIHCADPHEFTELASLGDTVAN